MSKIKANIITVNNSSELSSISNLNNFIIFFTNINVEDLKDIYDETELNKLSDFKLKVLLDNINSQIKKYIKLLNPLDNKGSQSWLSKKYNILNIFSRDISLERNFYKNIENNIIIPDITHDSGYQFKNINITDIGSIDKYPYGHPPKR